MLNKHSLILILKACPRVADQRSTFSRFSAQLPHPEEDLHLFPRETKRGMVLVLALVNH
jgi:hypothetical protein